MAKKAVTKNVNYSVATGKISFTVSQSYRAPMKKIWEAATKKTHLQKFFVDKVSGDFNDKFETVFWTFAGHGEFPIYPVGYAPGKFLEFYWPMYGTRSKLSLVRFDFTEKNGLVTVEITESGWSQSGLSYAFANCEGWTEFLVNLKAYVLHKKDLRTKKR
ncbi:MAG: SRPBCC domain-containing protein [Calditrichaeota bacterium]|nr:SRPBCC domain-containing protein [Calditrichota bacterium]MCB9369281.1 SRPBCC domain-containing protein [Calditrichota bacterium]